MRWLQFSTIDLVSGLGGVEVHARCLARELAKLGIEARLSSDPAIFKQAVKEGWEVIHTHGSSPLSVKQLGRIARQPLARRSTVVHTLHGTTLGRMAACGEWLWPGGYAAYSRELRGVAGSDVVLSTHDRLHLYRLAGRLGKVRAVCGNGWDSGAVDFDHAPARVGTLAASANGPFWVFIGRGGDHVKATDRLMKALKLLPDMHLAAVPGDGFEDGLSGVFRTGRLSNMEVHELLKLSAGLVLVSRYEGLPLVVLEALAEGTPVVTTAVGGITTLPSGLQGLVLTASSDPRAIADAVRAAERLPLDATSRTARAQANRRLLWTWKDAASVALAAVRDARMAFGEQV